MHPISRKRKSQFGFLAFPDALPIGYVNFPPITTAAQRRLEADYQREERFYNITNDKSEATDRTQKHPEIVGELQTALKEKEKGIVTPLWAVNDG